MSENTTATVTAAPLSNEDKAKNVEALSPFIRPAVEVLNAQIVAHNKNVDLIKRANAGNVDPWAYADEFLSSYDGEEKEIIQVAAMLEKAKDMLEKAKLRAIQVVDKFNNEKPDEAAVTKATAEVSQSTKDIRELKEALTKITSLVPGTEVDFDSIIFDVKTLRGVSKNATSSGAGTGTSRPRFALIEIKNAEGNFEKVGKEVDKNGVKEFRSTITMLAQELTKRLPSGASVTATDIQNGILAHLGEGYTFDKLTDGQVIEWVFTKTFKVGGDEQTKDFTLKFTK